MTASKPCSAFRRRHLARICATVTAGVSSMYNGASINTLTAEERFFHSCSVLMRPVLSRWPSISAVELKRRWTSSSRPISREKRHCFPRGRKAHILCHIKNDRRLPHGRARCHDNQISFLEPVCKRVQFGKSVASPVISSWFWYFLVISSNVC